MYFQKERISISLVHIVHISPSMSIISVEMNIYKNFKNLHFFFCVLLKTMGNRKINIFKKVQFFSLSLKCQCRKNNDNL